MNTLEMFTAKDLRNRPAHLFRDMQNGQLALVTNKGRPAFLAVPFDEKLLQLGIHKVLAIYLFEKELLTLSQAAKMANISLEDFIEMAGQMGISVVDYPPDELAGELERAL